ncbi:MAG: P-loop NTPase [Microthrixaceae bacterium]|jgi:pilus assembly protein CpaE|nr:P-loop NTPase [Microthrixaceae bacterium]
MPNFTSTELNVPLLVVEADPAIRSRLAMQLGEQAIPLETLMGVEERYGASPFMLVLGPTCARSGDLGGAEQMLARRPDLGAILIAEDLSTDLFQRAIRSGVRDVLGAPVDTGQLNEAVSRVAQTLVISRPSGSSSLGGVDDSGEQGRVITVFSTKGGAGKSVMATNLGVLLAQRSEGVVALVDADLQFGDIAVMLKLAPQHTIVDAVGSFDRLDVGFLETLLSTHPQTGLKVLPAPLEPAFADQIGADQMTKIIRLLRSFCDYVVIDTPAYFNEVVLALIEESDDVILVAGMDIPNIKNVKIGLQTLRLLNTPMSKIHLILNRANSKVKLEVSEVERTLQVKAEALIPSDVVVPQSVNKGMPVVIDSPKSAIAKSLEQVADLFLPSTEPAAKKRGWR